MESDNVPKMGGGDPTDRGSSSANSTREPECNVGDCGDDDDTAIYSGGDDGITPKSDLENSSSDCAEQFEGQIDVACIEIEIDLEKCIDKTISVEDFHILKVLGTGAYGRVFLVRKINGPDKDKLYAMKVLKKAVIIRKPKTTEHTMSERHILEEIRQCPYLVTLYYAFQSKEKLFLILDFIQGGELFNQLYLRERFSESEARVYISEITVALQTLHRLSIVYRDLKLENLLLDADGHIVLTDFGLSKEFRSGGNPAHQRTFSFCGTTEYMAPELILQSGHGTAIDWWSLGVLAFELLTGRSPFSAESSTKPSMIPNRIINESPPIPSSLTQDCQGFLSALMTKDPRKRLGGGSRDAEEIKEHKFFDGFDWDRVYKRALEAPVVPTFSNEEDVSYFSEEFTSKVPILSPDVMSSHASHFRLEHEKLFRGFSYIAPSVLLSKNSITIDLMQMPIEANNNFSLDDLTGTPFLTDFEVLSDQQPLGRGNFSIVYKCTNRETLQPFAVKVVSNQTANYFREVDSLRICQDHPNILNLNMIYEDSLHVYIVTELCTGGELLQKLEARDVFTENEAREYFRQLASATDYMHSRGIVHRDLKFDNILLRDSCEDSVLKIIDFGFSRALAGNSGQSPSNIQTPCFTLPFAAPEILHLATSGGVTLEGYDESCDNWSLGVILFTMLSGMAPFWEKSIAGMSMLIDRIKVGAILAGPAWKMVSAEAKELVKSLLTIDVSRRLVSSQILSHEWLRSSLVTDEPLMTPGALVEHDVEVVKTAVKQTYDAYREGFMLNDVSNAPLAKRRRLKFGSLSSSEESASSAVVASSSSMPVRSMTGQRGSNSFDSCRSNFSVPRPLTPSSQSPATSRTVLTSLHYDTELSNPFVFGIDCTGSRVNNGDVVPPSTEIFFLSPNPEFEVVIDKENDQGDAADGRDSF